MRDESKIPEFYCDLYCFDNRAHQPDDHRFEDVQTLPLIIPAPGQNNFSGGENIPGADVVGSDGSLSPCVMKQTPVQGENIYYINGQTCVQQNLSFGNIRQESLKTIRHRQNYRQFIREFRKDKGRAVCHNCLKRQIENF